MSKVERVEIGLRKLSPVELYQIRDWLDDLIEDSLEESIRRGEQEVAEGRFARIRVFE